MGFLKSDFFFIRTVGLGWVWRLPLFFNQGNVVGNSLRTCGWPWILCPGQSGVLLLPPPKPIKARDWMFIALAQSQPCKAEDRKAIHFFALSVYDWSIADFHSCVRLFCAAHQLSYTQPCLPFHMLFCDGLSLDIEYNSLCYIGGPCTLSTHVLYVYIYSHMFYMSVSLFLLHRQVHWHRILLFYLVNFIYFRIIIIGV